MLNANSASSRAKLILERFYQVLDREMHSNAERIEKCLEEVVQGKVLLTAGSLEIHVDVCREEWSPSVSRIFHLLIDGTLMKALGDCVFSEKFRTSLTDLPKFEYIDPEHRERLSILLHEFVPKMDFSLSVNLHDLISQLFGTAEPSKKLVLTLKPVVTAVENELSDEEPVTAQLAAILLLPIGIALMGDNWGLSGEINEAGEAISTCYLKCSLFFYDK